MAQRAHPPALVGAAVALGRIGVTSETVLAALVAVPAGLAMAWVLTDAIQFRAFGWTMPFVMSATPLGGTLLLGVAAALLAGLYPAWQASRHDPAPQLRED